MHLSVNKNAMSLMYYMYWFHSNCFALIAYMINEFMLFFSGIQTYIMISFFLEIWKLVRNGHYMPPQQTSKKLFESLRIIDPEDQRQPSFAECLLFVIQCIKIVDEVNLLWRREVVLKTNLSSQADNANSEPIHVFEVEVSCTQGALKVNEKVCRISMAVTL